MPQELINSESPDIIRIFKHLEYIVELFKEHPERFRPVFNGDRYLTETELAKQLKLTQRTLIEYRKTGILPYYKLGGRILYRERDIVDLLERNKMVAFKK